MASFGLSLIPQGFLTALIISFSVYALIRGCIRFYNYRRRINKIKKLPGITGHWLLGGLVEFPGPGKDGLDFMHDRTYDYPKLAYMFFGPFNIAVACNHPETAKYILKTSEPKPREFGGYFNAFPWLGEGLLIAGGKKWARNRRLLTPAFHFDILKPYIDVNNRAADILLEKLAATAEKNEYFEVSNYISLTTFEIILKCAFSFQDDVQRQGENHPYVRAVKQMLHTMVYRLLRPWLYPNFIFYLTPTGREFKKSCDYAHKVSSDVVKTRKKTLEQSGGNVIKNKKYLDFLDILLTARDEKGTGLTDREIRDEVDTFLFEGHDTTSSGISWTLYSLAQNPEWMKKCQDEIDRVLSGRDSDDIEWDDLPGLKMVNICIKESLRLYTTVPFIQRQITKDLYIDGYLVPEGTQVDIQLYNILHNPYVWKDPMEYKPERFLGENAEKLHSYANIPFSAGPRNCIGQNFAMHEMKVVISRILRKFDLHIDPERIARPEIIVVLKTEKGMYLKATPRKEE